MSQHRRMRLQAAAATQEAGSDSTKKLWGGRFTGKTDPLMEKFNESLPFDKRMWAEDIRVSSAVQWTGYSNRESKHRTCSMAPPGPCTGSIAAMRD